MAHLILTLANFKSINWDAVVPPSVNTISGQKNKVTNARLVAFMLDLLIFLFSVLKVGYTMCHVKVVYPELPF